MHVAVVKVLDGEKLLALLTAFTSIEFDKRSFNFFKH